MAETFKTDNNKSSTLGNFGSGLLDALTLDLSSRDAINELYAAQPDDSRFYRAFKGGAKSVLGMPRTIMDINDFLASGIRKGGDYLFGQTPFIEEAGTGLGSFVTPDGKTRLTDVDRNPLRGTSFSDMGIGFEDVPDDTTEQLNQLSDSLKKQKGPAPRPTNISGGQTSEKQTVESGDDTNQNREFPTTKEELSPLEEAFSSAMSEYEKINAGEEKPRKTLEEYKKDFADATGIDVSGKVDKSSALQAFGLALMQNKAGKGFNVSKILSSVGEAGEKAMPELEKAKERARAAQLSAGKYGLEQVAADDAAELAARVAEKKALNDLNLKRFDANSKALIKEAELQNAMDIALLNNRTKLREASIAASEAPDLYTDKTEKISLFPDAPDAFKVSAFIQDPNVNDPVDVKLTDGSYKAILSTLKLEEENLNRKAAEFQELQGLINEGITVPQQLTATLKRFGRGFGIGLGEKPDPVSQAKFILTKIQAQEAPKILQEAGKTISDADRQRVKDIVGDINYLEASDSELLVKVSEIYKSIVDSGRRNLDTAYATLESYGYDSGRPTQNVDEELSEEEAAELAALRQGG